MPDDFGYFGKGIEGYAHYNEATKDEANKGGNGGGNGGGSGKKIGCLAIIIVITLLDILFRAFN